MKNIAKIVRIIEKDFFVINKGSSDGIKYNHVFLVYKKDKEIFDPDTHESLGFLEIVRGKGEVIHVQEKQTTIKRKFYNDYIGANPEIGDFAKRI